MEEIYLPERKEISPPGLFVPKNLGSPTAMLRLGTWWEPVSWVRMEGTDDNSKGVGAGVHNQARLCKVHI